MSYECVNNNNTLTNTADIDGRFEKTKDKLLLHKLFYVSNKVDQTAR